MSAPYKGESTIGDIPGMEGRNTAGGDGVVGVGRRGVVGSSDEFQGVFGKSRDNAGVVGESEKMHAVFGVTHSHFAGVFGVSDAGGTGVAGESKTGRGIHGISESGSGVHGQSVNGRAIEGWSQTNYGVTGDSRTFAGVRGTSVDGTGTEGWSTNGTGVFATSKNGEGLHAETSSSVVAAIAGINLNPDGTGAAVYGKKAGSQGHAGFFDGNVHVTGDITLANADCAEHFDIADTKAVEPGTVMVLGPEGLLHESSRAYDRRVAGVISGAGDYKPGIVLDRRQSQANRQPIALLGKVYCKVDADYGPIEVGDLLTTSDTPGHAMKAADPLRVLGAVIGKALQALAEGKGEIPILVALR